MSNNILKVTFDASTVNGTIIKDMRYSPSMSSPTLYSQFPNILFIPSIKISKELFDEGLGDDDIKKIFLSSAQLDNFITRLQEKKRYKPITIADAREKGIIYSNIKFILDLFFKTGTNFFIYQTQYAINSYKWNNKYIITPVPGQKTPTVEIKIQFVLHKGSELSFIESTRLNCIQKRESIVNDYYYLVGLEKPLGKTAPLSERPVDTSNKPRLTPPVKKTVTTTTTTYTGGKRTGKRIRTKKNRK
jgi:hypothetical protein